MLPFCRPSNLRTVTWTLDVGTSLGGDYVIGSLTDGNPEQPLAIEETTVGLEGDAGSAVRIDGVSIIHHNFAAGTDVRLRIHSSASWATPDITITVVVPAWKGRFAPHLYFDVAAAVPVIADRTRRYLYLDNTDANDVAVKIGEVVVLGVVEELSTGLLTEADLPQTYGRSLNPSRAGVATVHDYRTRTRAWVGATELDVADEALLRSLQDDSYGVRPFIFWPTGQVSDEPIYGRFSGATYAPQMRHMDVGGSSSLAFEELSCGEAY